MTGRRAWLVLTALPPLALLGLYLGFSLDFPRLDQWEFVLFLQKFHAGTLTSDDFWAQHNEHRLVFPRLVMLGLAWLTDWDIRAELALNYVLGAAIFLACTVLLRRPSWEKVFLVSLLAFSMAQWRNWFLGWQMQVFMSLLAVLGMVWLLSGGRGGWLRFYGALGLAVVATFSFANGALAWPLGVVLLVLRRTSLPTATPFPPPTSFPRTRESDLRSMPERQAFASDPTDEDPSLRDCMSMERRSDSRFRGNDVEGRGDAQVRGYVGVRTAMAAWCVVAIATMGAYFVGYSAPDYHGDPRFALTHPITTLAYVLAYLGQPVAQWSFYAACGAGAFGLVMWGVLIVKAGWRAHPALFALGCYAIGTAVLSAGGRVELGTAQAMSSRYVTLATPLWIALIGLTPEIRPARIVTVLIALSVAASSLHGAYRWTERYNAMSPARPALLRGEMHDAYRFIYPPDPEEILRRREVLVEHGLSIFRGAPE